MQKVCLGGGAGPCGEPDTATLLAGERWGWDLVGAGLASGKGLLVGPLSPGGIYTPRDDVGIWFEDCNLLAEILAPQQSPRCLRWHLTFRVSIKEVAPRGWCRFAAYVDLSL